MRHHTSSHRSELGFTLIEIAVAVAILGASLATIIALNTRLLSTVSREQNLLRAALYGQYILTFLEIAPAPPEVGTDDGELSDRLKKLGYFQGDEFDSLNERLEGWRYVQNVTAVDFGEFPDIMRRIDLSIRWDTGNRDQLDLVLYLKSPLVQGANAAPQP